MNSGISFKWIHGKKVSKTFSNILGIPRCRVLSKVATILVLTPSSLHWIYRNIQHGARNRKPKQKSNVNLKLHNDINIHRNILVPTFKETFALFWQTFDNMRESLVPRKVLTFLYLCVRKKVYFPRWNL